jgi:hypothetical protein
VPGFTRFTAPSPIPTAIELNSTVSANARRPMRPTRAALPISATPSTSALKSNGTTTMKIIVRKICPTGCMSPSLTAFSVAFLAPSGSNAWARPPRSAPATRPIATLVWSAGRGPFPVVIPAILARALPGPP